MDVLISDSLAMAGHSYRASRFLWMAFLNVWNKDLDYASKIANVFLFFFHNVKLFNVSTFTTLGFLHQKHLLVYLTSNAFYFCDAYSNSDL